MKIIDFEKEEMSLGSIAEKTIAMTTGVMTGMIVLMNIMQKEYIPNT